MDSVFRRWIIQFRIYHKVFVSFYSKYISHNREADLQVLPVRFFNHTPVMAMLSYSNFGADKEGSPVSVHEAVDYMQQNYPDLAIDGEMQVNFAMNREMRDAKYPFTRLKGKDVNTLIFPNLSSANSAYKLLQAMDTDSELDRKSVV